MTNIVRLTLNVGDTTPQFTIRVTSNMRLRAHDHYISTTPVGGKGRAGPSLLHNMLEGPNKYVNTRWM
jgi:hypothetical protein